MSSQALDLLRRLRAAQDRRETLRRDRMTNPAGRPDQDGRYRDAVQECWRLEDEADALIAWVEHQQQTEGQNEFGQSEFAAG